MSIDPSKVAATEFTAAFFALPLLFWLAMYMAARWWSINWRPVLPWLKILRWMSWGCGTALFVSALARHVFPLAYGIIIFGFSAGLSIPESWVKRRFAAELRETPYPHVSDRAIEKLRRNLKTGRYGCRSLWGATRDISRPSCLGLDANGQARPVLGLGAVCIPLLVLSRFFVR